MDPRFLDHFQNPRNVGRLEDPNGTAQVDNPVCGDELQLDLELEGERVTRVAWKVRGCSGAIAAASAMSELVQGRTVAEAAAVDRDAIEAALGGLPALKRHGADLAADGLRAALDAARGD
jgi:nitrogen fixation NifU-like protein